VIGSRISGSRNLRQGYPNLQRLRAEKLSPEVVAFEKRTCERLGERVSGRRCVARVSASATSWCEQRWWSLARTWIKLLNLRWMTNVDEIANDLKVAGVVGEERHALNVRGGSDYEID